MKRFFVFILFFTVFGTISAWDEFNHYSIKDELSKPGVKLVAVDFYATWCEPCNAAIPKWKKLQEKYGDKGFKLIVVSVQSNGNCSQPPQWNPDKIVCDYDGEIANAWHANDLPQAFLWSWQGNLLVAHGGVDGVTAAVEQYFKKIPRVYVEEGNDKNIYNMVRSELIKNSKIEVVASDEERAALAELRKKSKNLNYDKKLRCKLGEELSANSRLVISTQKRGKKDALVLEFFSAEKGCLSASGTAMMNGNPETEVAEAVYNLLKNLLGDVKMPGEGGKPVKAQKTAAQNFQDTVACEYARSEAKDFAWKAYLKDYPKGKCADEAKVELDKAACKKAEKKKSVNAWKAYLKEYPNGKCAAKAQEEFDSAACKTAESKNTIDDWKKYLKAFPTGKCLGKAQKEMDIIACKTAENKNTVDGWKAYLKDFPKGICAAKAQEEFDNAACKTAENKNTVNGWKAYLKDYPKGKCAAKAQEEFDKKACRNAEKKNTADIWKKYLEVFPDGKCAAQAKTAIRKLEPKKAEKAEKTAETETYRPYQTAGISLIAAGAAVTVAGVAGFHVAYDKNLSKYRNMKKIGVALQSIREGLTYEEYHQKGNDYRKKARTFKALEITSGILGGSLLVTGVVLTVVKKEKPKEKVSLSNISVVPADNGFYASLGFEF